MPAKKSKRKPVKKEAPMAAKFVCRCGPGGKLLPLLLIVIGVFLLGRDLGWFRSGASIWSVVIILVGVFWLAKGCCAR